LPLSDVVPWAAAPTDATVSPPPSGSLSLASTSTSTLPSSLTEALSSTASGGALEAETVTATWPVSVPPLPSETV